jgi:hypothetical protein
MTRAGYETIASPTSSPEETQCPRRESKTIEEVTNSTEAEPE